MTRCVFIGMGLAVLAAAAGADNGPAPFKNNPKARAAYDGMVAAMRKAKSLSWTCQESCGSAGKVFARSTYRIWLQKPNYARLEAGGRDATGIMVLDGSTIWLYWPEGKPAGMWDSVGKRAEEYKLYSHKFYQKQPAPLAKHSIGHVAANFGTVMMIFDPSTFHGYTDSLQPYIDGVRFVKGRRVAGEDCLGIEVSFMKHQRSWVIWLSRKDRIPRRLEETVRVKSDLVITEDWSNVRLNALQSSKFFAWSPPKGWKEYHMPAIGEGLLACGSLAPDFDFAGLEGGRVKLSDYRGKVVWLNKWRCG